MSKDIRSFFTSKSKPKEKPKPKVNLSDDDEIPESPDVQVKSKKKQSRKKRVLSDSSDEEIFTKKSKKTINGPKENDKNKKAEISLKEVNVADLFGSAPIKRTEPIVKKDKNKKTEIGIHDDDDFEKSLLEIDNIEELAKNAEKELVLTAGLKSPDKGKTNGDTQSTNLSDGDAAKEAKDEKTSKLTSYKIPKRVPTEDKSKTRNDKLSPDKSKSSIYKKSSPHQDKKSSSHRKSSPAREKRSPSKDKKSHHIKVDKTMDKNKNEKKRDFSEFVDGDNMEAKEDSSHKKKKLDKSLNSSVLSDEERHERKRYSAALYQNYLNRSGPKNLGAKEMPQGAAGCLRDCAFLLTGVLASFEREEVAECVARCGGAVKSGISRKVTHVLAGDDAGPAKLAKAQELGIKIIDEDEFISMIKERSKNSSESEKDANKTSAKPEKSRDNAQSKDEKRRDRDVAKSENKKDKEDAKAENKKDKEDAKAENKKDKIEAKSANRKHKEDLKAEKKKDKTEAKSENRKEKDEAKSEKEEAKIKSEKVSPDAMKSFKDKIQKNFYGSNKVEKNNEAENSVKSEPRAESSPDNVSKAINQEAATGHLMWVDKYKPQNIKQIIGQHGDSSNVKKLMNWLSKWYISRRQKLSKPSPWAKSDDGAYFKAALLSGPPGVGKTTTVSLVCKELGFDTVELNASDARSRNLVQRQVGELLTTTSLAGYAKGAGGRAALSVKHVLVMDEVDGMAGNEDRGGLQELIALIKTASVPVICMCNERNSDKMRTLANYCYDLKFAKPRVDQIKSAMLSVCCKERIRVPADALTRLIAACNQDVRQTLTALSVWAAGAPGGDVTGVDGDAGAKRKDLKMGPWDAVRRVFSAEEHRGMTLADRSDLFFHDYNIAPLFVQENYINVTPRCDKKDVLRRLSAAADAISLGDLVEARIRRSQAWSLLPVQAIFSSVLPGAAMAGHVAGQIQFPGWLGKNSRGTRLARLATEVHAHTRLSTTGSKTSIYLDYARALRDAVTLPLRRGAAGVEEAAGALAAYRLPREDLDALAELAAWPGQRDPMLLVDPKVKAAMTRAYNKHAPALPYAPAAVVKKKHREETFGNEEDDDDDEEDARGDSEPENDALIKVKKTTSKGKAASGRAAAGTSKGDKGKKSKGKK